MNREQSNVKFQETDIKTILGNVLYFFLGSTYKEVCTWQTQATSLKSVRDTKIATIQENAHACVCLHASESESANYCS